MPVPAFASASAVAALSAAALIGFAAPATAQAACYPPANPQCATSGATISDTTVVAGQTVTVQSGVGTFDAGSQVTVDVLGISSTTTAASNGNASVTFTVPADAPAGPTAVTFSGVSEGAATTVEVPFTVVTAAAEVVPATDTAASGGALPTTGSDTIVPLTLAGVALVAVGGGIVVFARSRRRSSANSFA